jgi:transcription antitermination protein NusB
MAARHRSRQRALQVLYQWDMTKRPVDEAIRAFYDTLDADKIAAESMEHEPMEEETEEKDDESGEELASGRDPFMEELARGASQMAADIDQRIAEKSAHWKLERMPIVDRNILRLGIYEMSRQDTPAAVVIDEALELARQFSGEESVAFINGVLDAVHKDMNIPHA